MRSSEFIGKGLCAAILLYGASMYAQTPKRPVQPSDCVTVKYPLLDSSFHSSIQINRQGTRVAYLIKVPNLKTNQNDVELYIRHLPIRFVAQTGAVLVRTGMSSPRWLDDGIHLAILMRERGRAVVSIVDARDGRSDIIARADTDIVEYSISRRGDRMVFATEHSVEDRLHHTPEEVAHGYQVPFPLPASPLPAREIYFSQRLSDQSWLKPVALKIQSPFTGTTLETLRYQQSLLLSLSPDGRKLLMRYMERPEDAPPAWRENPYVHDMIASGFPGVAVMLLYEIDHHRSSITFETPWDHNLPLWSPDGKAFVVFAQSPIKATTPLELNASSNVEDGEHLYWVDPGGHRSEIVYRGPVVSPGEQPLFWQSDGTVYVHTATDRVAGFSRVLGGWSEKKVLRIPSDGNPDVFPVLASDGNFIIGEQEGVVRPPEMFELDSDRMLTFQQLNPQFRNLTLAQVRHVEWTATSGNRIEGRLFLPSGYQAGHPYPLVIQTKPGWNGFACDTGISHFPSFAPQPIANADILYLQRVYPDTFSASAERSFYPREYPAGVAEAAYEMGVWDGAINELSSQGIVDEQRVGIIGFSRSGWYTEFSLAHSIHRYRAATVTDNVQYSVGTYWLLHSSSALHGSEMMYGGPPYGKTLENWQKYSISFNLDKIHTPLLMEALGHGMPYNDWRAAPSFLATTFEVFTGLNRLAKPVELVYYPSEDHQPDHPQARLATLQRNLDWYRFWLQGYERPYPEDKEQYVRWQRLRELNEGSR